MKTLHRQINGGTKFLADSKGKEATWIVTKRIKTDYRNIIYAEVIKGIPQKRSYTGQQFGILLHDGVIKLRDSKGRAI